MLVTYETRIIGTEDRVSAKGNNYSVVAFMDGTSTVRAIVDNDCDIVGLPMFEPVHLNLKVSLGKYSDVRLMGWKKN